MKINWVRHEPGNYTATVGELRLGISGPRVRGAAWWWRVTTRVLGAPPSVHMGLDGNTMTFREAKIAAAKAAIRLARKTP